MFSTQNRLYNQEYNLDNTNFIGYIQGIIIWSQPNIGFLSSVWPANKNILVKEKKKKVADQRYPHFFIPIT